MCDSLRNVPSFHRFRFNRAGYSKDTPGYLLTIGRDLRYNKKNVCL